MRAMLVSMSICAAAASALAQEPPPPVPEDVPLVAEPAPEAAESETGLPASKGTTANATAANLAGPSSGLGWTLSWGVSAGLQRNPPQLEQGSYTSADTSLQAGLRYKLHDKVFLSAGLSTVVDLTSMPNNNRRANLGATSARLNFRNLYNESITGISVGGNVSYSLPTIDNLMYGNPSAGALGGAVQLFRPVGPVMLVGSFGVNKPLFLRARAYADCDPATVAQAGASCPVDSKGEPLPVGSWNSRYSLSSSLLAMYGTGPWSFVTSMTYVMGTTYSQFDPTQLGDILANPNGNNRYSTSFVLQAGYAIYDWLTVSAGFSNAAPTLTDRESYNNPFFDPRFASVSLGVDVVR